MYLYRSEACTRLQDGKISRIRYDCLSLTTTGEPQELFEALAGENWKDDIDTELDALMKNDTWHLVPSDSAKNIIDRNWFSRIKLKANGSLDRYKAKLVVKGFKQQYGIDYEETLILWLRATPTEPVKRLLGEKRILSPPTVPPSCPHYIRVPHIRSSLPQIFVSLILHFFPNPLSEQDSCFPRTWAQSPGGSWYAQANSDSRCSGSSWSIDEDSIISPN